MSDTEHWSPPIHESQPPIDPAERSRFWWQAAIAMVVILVMGILTYRSFWVNNDKPDEKLVAAVDVLRRQVEAAGEEPAVPPPEDIVSGSDVVPIPGPEGPEGDRGPTGPAGRDGRDGQPCLPTNPFCVGPEGAAGAPGEPGATGPAGETIVGPEGPQGPAGADGAPGADGRGITSVQVTEVGQNDCRLIVTYTDGSTQDAGAVDCPEPPLVPIG
jgi:hypothetical protein